MFAGERGPHRDALVLGAALALEVSGVAADVDAGRKRVEAVLDGGAAERLVHNLVACSSTALARKETGHG